MPKVRMNGGVVGPTNTANASTASGVYSVVEAMFDKQAGAFPVWGGYSEPQFNLNSLLLHGDGSSGANNSVFQDSSTNALTITRNGTPTQGSFSPFSQTGWSAYFSGSSSSPDFVSTASSSTFNVSSGNWTVEAWFWTDSSDASNRYITFIPASGTAYGLIPSGSNYVLNQFGTSSPIGTSGSLLKKSQWTHVAIVKNGATTYIYVDGVLGGSGTVSWSNSAHTIFFGGNGISFTYNYSGWISNARIVMGTALYTGSTYTVPTSPLTAVAGTQFLTLNNNRIYDSSGNNATVNLGVTTGPAVQPFSPFAPSFAYGVSSVGGSVYFNGSTDYLTGTYSTTNYDWWSTDYTLECWVYPLSLTGFGYLDGTNPKANLIGNNAYNGTANYWTFGPYSDGTVGLTYFNGSSVGVFSTATVKINQWNHIAFTKTTSGITIFVNGVASSTTAVSGTPQSGTSQPLTIGAGNTKYINAYVSNLRILKGSSLYSGNFTPPSSPVTAITNTQLLVNGTNAGVYDSTAKNDIITAGTVQISTAQAKFGGSSLYFDGTGGNYLYSVSNPIFSFGTGNFTIEFWMYPTASFSTTRIMSTYTGGIAIYPNNSGNIIVDVYGVTTRVTTTSTVSINTWTHIAVVRLSGTTTVYLNGVSGGSGVDATSYTNSGLYIGTDSGTNKYTGYLDEIRITNGYARYTSAFTPPTTAFLNQ